MYKLRLRQWGWTKYRHPGAREHSSTATSVPRVPTKKCIRSAKKRTQAIELISVASPGCKLQTMRMFKAPADDMLTRHTLHALRDLPAFTRQVGNFRSCSERRTTYAHLVSGFVLLPRHPNIGSQHLNRAFDSLFRELRPENGQAIITYCYISPALLCSSFFSRLTRADVSKLYFDFATSLANQRLGNHHPMTSVVSALRLVVQQSPDTIQDLLNLLTLAVRGPSGTSSVVVSREACETWKSAFTSLLENNTGDDLPRRIAALNGSLY